MQQLSNMDATFLNLESKSTPMHIGCILQFSNPADGKMTFARFKNYIASRLSISPVFRRKLATLPLNVDLPYWVDDRTFSIDNHVKEHRISAISSQTQRETMVDQFFSETLDPAIPLWEMRYVDMGNSFNVLMKFHHAALDGKAAEKILAGLLSPTSTSIEVDVDSWTPAPPSYTQMTANKIRGLYRSPKKIAAFGKSLGHALNNSYRLRQRDKSHSTPPHFFLAPATSFNGEVKHSRRIRSAHLSLNKIKAIKSLYPGYTVNDVVLAICSGAVRQHLTNTNKLPNTPIVAMAPVSKRLDNTDGTGNSISAMLVSLATDIDSATDRLHAIHRNAVQSKEYNKEVSMEEVIDHLPSWSSSLVVKAYTRLRIGKWLKPVFNMIITNVPGSPVPLYLDGAKLKSMEGMAPIVDGMGLTMVVTSYLDTLTIAATTTIETAKESPDLAGYLQASLDELYAAATADHPTQAVSGF